MAPNEPAQLARAQSGSHTHKHALRQTEERQGGI